MCGCMIYEFVEILTGLSAQVVVVVVGTGRAGQGSPKRFSILERKLHLCFATPGGIRWGLRCQTVAIVICNSFPGRWVHFEDRECEKDLWVGSVGIANRRAQLQITF